MPPDYQQYTVEDLTRDESFRRWVIHRDPQWETFWSVWLTENPECAGKIQLAYALLRALEEKDTALSAGELEHISQQITRPNRLGTGSRWRTTGFPTVASLLLLFGISYAVVWYRPAPTAGLRPTPDVSSPALAGNFVEVSNKTAVPRQFTLQDRSTVTLYPGSTVRYPRHFTGSIREVYLQGRAFFVVTKNLGKPFWVYTNRLSTQVLGTSFMVTADGHAASVNVRTGRVLVYTRNDIQKIRLSPTNKPVGLVLTPNQQVALANDEEHLVKSVVERPMPLANVDRRVFVFDEVPVTDVFALFEKTFGLPIMYDAAAMKHCYLTANLSQESFFDQLNLICKITHSSYELVDGQIIILGGGCDNR